MDQCRDYEVFLQYLFAIAANCENSSESDKLLVNESLVRDSGMRLLVTVWCIRLMRLVR